MSAEAPKPYVISADVGGLMTRWAATKGLEVPANGFFGDLTQELSVTIRGYFNSGEVEVLEESLMRQGLLELIANSSLPVVSIDRAYIDEDTPNIEGFLDVTRTVDENFRPVGLWQRPGAPTLNEQLDSLSRDEVSPIVLVDDVIFHGENIAMNLAPKLAERNRPVAKVIAAVAVGHGRKILNDAGIEVEAVYSFDEVVDEVCERDFRVGVPMSGRTVVSSEGDVYSAPYIAPFGDVVSWGSIPPEHASDFSALCIEQSITLWQQVEKESGRTIPTDMLPRQVKGIYDATSVVSALNQLR